jgi:septal ring factor EnvC (AmiA/AmiB activator)
VLTARYALALADWNGEPDAATSQRLRALGAICRDLVALRWSDHNAARLRMEQEKFARKRRKAQEEEAWEKQQEQERLEEEECVSRIVNLRAKADHLETAIEDLQKNYPETARAAIAADEARKHAVPDGAPSDGPPALPRDSLSAPQPDLTPPNGGVLR